MNNDMRYLDGMDNAEYHATKAISKTTLDLSSRSLFAPLWAKQCPQDAEKIKTFDFGDAMHAICLEPDRLKKDFAVMPKLNLRTNAGKQEKEEFIEESKGKTILTHDEYKKLNLMYESVMCYLPSRELIETEGHAERSYFWRDEQTGLECKCRPDKYIQSRELLVDVKTTDDLGKFHYSVDDYRYYVQDPWYCDGVARFDWPVRMEFLVIQKTIEIGRYPVMVVKLSDEAIEYGRMTYRNDLNKFAEFMNSEQEIETPELPMSYKFNQKAEEFLGEIF